MSYEINFTLAAELDLKLAFDWYEKESVGLGWEFRNEIALCIEKITDDRVSYQVYIHDIHKIGVARFPYIIYYRKNEISKRILIGAVLHERRNPEEIKMRLL